MNLSISHKNQRRDFKKRETNSLSPTTPSNPREELRNFKTI